MNSENKRLMARTRAVFASAKQLRVKACHSKSGSTRNLLFGVLTMSTVLGCLPKTAHAASLQFDEIYVFGDSLSDVGNTFEATSGIIPPSPLYFEGRFSNGPIWVDKLASKLGVTFNPDPNLDTNFAVGGATTGSSNTIPFLGLPGLQGQIDDFIESAPENPSANPNGLYIVWAGAIDYLGGVTADPAEPVGNIVSAVTALTTVGAKNILVANLPNLGELPQARESDRSDALNALTEAHNLSLDQSLVSLNQTLSPDVNLFRLDVDSLVDEALTNPAKFGFTNVTDACLSLPPCPNPNEYVFWDGIHPTARSHAILAKSAYSVLKSKPIPEPSSTLGVLTFGALGAGWLLKHRQKQQQKAPTRLDKVA